MKTKLIISAACIIAAFFLYSFTNAPVNNISKTALVTLLNGKGDNQGFIITYGDGTIEKRATPIKLMDTENWIELQAKASMLIEEMKTKGYSYKGSHQLMTSVMIFQKD